MYIQKDESPLKVCSEYIWLWIAIIEPETKNMLAMSISMKRNMFVVTGHFLSDGVDEHGQHLVSTADDGTCILKHTDS